MSTNLVSIIIPAYNAEGWIAEALESCISQTYSPIEIIVVDDGSMDATPQIIEKYGARIRYQFERHRGGSAARNRGVALATGDFIQFLDADDYLLPEKIGRQVSFLQATGADAVYGDWRHQFHRSSGQIALGHVVIAAQHDDLLESLLAGWWVPSMALVYRRMTVVKSGGWDETFTVQDDHDFLISVASCGADVRYQPGCFSVYRRYGDSTLSTSDLPLWLANESRLLQKAETRLTTTGVLSAKYRRALANSYFRVARSYYDIDRGKHADLLRKTLELFPTFKPQESTIYNLTERFLGFKYAESLASKKRRIGMTLRQISRSV